MNVQPLLNKRHVTGFTAALILLVLTEACGESSRERKTENYEVVGEGSTGTVTSAIAGPGEQLPVSTPSMTGTMADTTTDFSLLESGASPGTVSSSGVPTTEPTQQDSDPAAQTSPTPRADIYFSKRPTPSPQPVPTLSGDPNEGDQMQEEEPTEQPPPPDEIARPDTNQPAEGDPPPSTL